MSQEFLQVVYLCQNVFNNAQTLGNIVLLDALKLYAEYSNWFPVNYVFDQNILQKLFNYIRSDNVEIKMQIIRCLGKIMNYSIMDLI